MKNNYSYLSDARKIELHYIFDDDSHTMNALVFNSCEKELLSIINDIAKTLKVAIDIEVEPLEEGSLFSRLRINPRNLELLNSCKKEILIGITLSIFGFTVADPAKLFLTEVIDNYFNGEDNKLKTELLRLSVEEKRIENKTKTEDNELSLEQKRLSLKEQKIDIERKQIELAKLKEDTNKKTSNLNQNKLAKRCSNYYESISKEQKVESIAVSIKSEDNQHTFETHKIERAEFGKFIITSNELESEIDKCANIEIIAPVLKKGNKYKWKGLYNNEVIEFNMKSNEFKTLIQTGIIEFKSGFSINCYLEIRKKQTSEGDEYISGYNVEFVNSYTNSETPTETPEGRKRRRIKEAEQIQLSLFDDLD